MAELGGTFDSRNVDPAKPIEALPPGWYAMKIVASDRRRTNDGKNELLKLEFEIDETRHPNFAGRKAWANLNLWHEKPETRGFAERDLSAICRAVGVPTVRDSSELHFKVMAVLLKEPDKGFSANQIAMGGYDAVEARIKSGATAAPAPAAAAPPQGGNGKAAAPASSSPPWGPR